MNSSEARRERREAERAERRREERLAEKAEREAEDQREEERRRQAAREEAEARATEERERDRRAELRARLRRERTAAARRAEAQAERRRVARADRAERERAEAARQQAVASRREEAAADEARRQAEQERRAEAAERQVAERRVEAEDAERSGQRRDQARAARREERQAADRQAEAERERRTAAAERQINERRAEDAEAAGAEERQEQTRETRRAEEEAAARREHQLAVRRRELLEARRRMENQPGARAERRRAAREARLRELVQERTAAEAERERTEERRALEASRRASERRAQEAEQARRRERSAQEGSARRAEREAEPEELPWLRTEDGRIVEWGGEPRLLRGVNVVGLDEAAGGETPLREALALDDPNLELLSEAWGVNLVRVPFSAGTLLGAPPVLAQLDELLGALTGSGVYTLLALTPAGGLPDQGTHDVWTLLAERYQEQPGALFEPFATTAPLGDDWPDAGLELVHTIRSVHQSSLLVLPGEPLRFEGAVVANVVCSIRDTRDSRPQLDERFAAFARRNAVLVSEWSNEGPDLGRSAIANAGLFERLELSWCAANWNAPPRLVADPARHRFTETRFGLIVRRALAGPVRPALTPF